MKKKRNNTNKANVITTRTKTSWCGHGRVEEGGLEEGVMWLVLVLVVVIFVFRFPLSVVYVFVWTWSGYGVGSRRA